MIDWLGTFSNILGEYINKGIEAVFGKYEPKVDKPKVEARMTGFIRKGNWPKK